MSTAASTSAFTHGEVELIILGLLVLGALIVIQPLLLSRQHNKAKFESTIHTSTGALQKITSFFQIPYVTWYLIHYGIGALALLGIVALALARAVDPSTVAALIGSLLGYTLGSATGHGAAVAQIGSTDNKKDTEDKTTKPS